MDIQKLKEKFIEHFGESSENIEAFFSPSRINIIGEHIDYNGGLVFPCAIEIGTYGIARINNSTDLNLLSLNLENNGSVSLIDIEHSKENDWMNFPLGVAKFIQEHGYYVGGLDVLVYGNIPNGSGLSSSSSLELLFGEMFNHFFNDGQISPTELALIGKETENKFIGVNSGIMDQFVIANGKKDNAILLNTESLEFDYFPFVLKDETIVILNTNKRRELKDSKYNQRRAECDEAVEIIKKYKPINYLCELDETDLELLNNIENIDVRKRAHHAIMENVRVKEATKALLENNIVRLGELLVESNDSLRELYEVTGPHLDSITKHANDFEGCLGARMTGAGFGGCGIAIVKNNKIDEFKDYVGKRYKADTGIEAEFIFSNVGNGVRKL